MNNKFTCCNVASLKATSDNVKLMTIVMIAALLAVAWAMMMSLHMRARLLQLLPERQYQHGNHWQLHLSFEKEEGICQEVLQCKHWGLLPVQSFIIFMWINSPVHIDMQYLVMLLLVISGRLCSLAVLCRTTDHYHLCSNLGVGISEACFIFDFASLPLEVYRAINLPCSQRGA